MNNISIKKYKNEYKEEVIRLIADSFKSKFVYKTNFKIEDVIDVLKMSWEIDESDAHYLHYMAIVDGKVAGVILVQVADSKKETNIIIYKFIKRFGLKNAILVLSVLEALSNHKYTIPYIEHLAVDSSRRGLGIGSQLLNYIDDRVKDMDFDKLSLMVTSTNPAKHLYLRQGYEVISSHTSKIKGKLVNEKEWGYMEKNL